MSLCLSLTAKRGEKCLLHAQGLLCSLICCGNFKKFMLIAQTGSLSDKRNSWTLGSCKEWFGQPWLEQSLIHLNHPSTKESHKFIADIITSLNWKIFQDLWIYNLEIYLR
jgi:hypothetical protein